MPDSGLRRLIARHVERERLEELSLPLHVVAVDVITGEELRLSSGSVVDACEFLDGGGAERPPIRMRMHRHHAPAGKERRPRVAN